MRELTEAWASYFLGLSQTDGHLSWHKTREKGKFELELARRDEDVLVRLSELIPCRTFIDRRSRSTNFSDNYDTTILRFHDLGMRRVLREWGVPVGKKSEHVAPPTLPFSEVDYIRGLVDGDGSVGFMEGGTPFISLNTSSDAIAAYFIDFIHRVTGKARKQNHRNRRDDCYNILVFSEDALLIAKLLYYDGCISLDRKRLSAERVKGWVRPRKAQKIWRRWTAQDDAFVLTHPVQAAVQQLGRSRRSIHSRRAELRRGRKPAADTASWPDEWREWTAEEDEYLLTHSVEECLKEFGRKPQAIYTRRSALRRQGREFHPRALVRRAGGPRRSPARFWTIDKDDFIASHTIEESMRQFGRTRRAVASRRWKVRRTAAGVQSLGPTP